MQQEKRPPLVVAMEWVSKVTTIGLEMALPPTVGHWLDERWDTEPWSFPTSFDPFSRY